MHASKHSDVVAPSPPHRMVSSVELITQLSRTNSYIHPFLIRNIPFLLTSNKTATEIIKGKSLDEIQTITNSEIAEHLKLPPVKLHCSMLAEDAIKAAVKDYKQKQ